MSGFIRDFHFINLELMNTGISALAFFAEKRKKELKHSPVLGTGEVPQSLTQNLFKKLKVIFLNQSKMAIILNLTLKTFQIHL